MSIKALRLAKALPRINPNVRGARAHILLLLADYADEKTLCAWPGADTLALDSGLTERTVRECLNDLERFGAIAGERRLGRKTRWKLTLGEVAERVGHAETSENGSGVRFEEPRKMLPVDPGNPPHEPRKSTTLTPENLSDRTLRNPQKKNPKGNPQRESCKGTRLPVGWIPSPADEAFARDLGLNPTGVAETFRDYWCSKPGKNAEKLDWSATWRNWCRNERPQRTVPSNRGGSANARIDTAQALGLIPDFDVSAPRDTRTIIDMEIADQ